MEPISASLGAADVARNLFGGLVDRWARARNAKVDAEALVRLLLMELRHNLAVLEVTVGRDDGIDSGMLWEIPLALHSEVLETVLGQGEVAAKAFSTLKNISTSESDLDAGTAGILTNVYVRMVSLRSLALLNRKSTLNKVQIDRRLRNLRTDLAQVVRALAP